jgi:hypothetical protein
MDMSFARRNRAASRSSDAQGQRNTPLSPVTIRKLALKGNHSGSISLGSLLARVAARQVVTPTAKIHALTENIFPEGEIVCAGVSLFAPDKTGTARRVSVSFNANAAAMISTCKQS